MMDKISELVKQLTIFGLIGGLNAFLSLIIYWCCVGIGIHYLFANAIGFILTVAISYVLNNIFTFRYEGQEMEWSIRKMLRAYASYFMTGMILNSVLLWLWNGIIGIDEKLSPILNLILMIPLNFLLNKVWVFNREREKTNHLMKGE